MKQHEYLTSKLETLHHSDDVPLGYNITVYVNILLDLTSNTYLGKMKLFLFILTMMLIFPSHQEKIDFNPYEVLNVDRGAPASEIRSSYKKLAKTWHPDKNKSPDAQDKFIRIQQAYEVILCNHECVNKMFQFLLLSRYSLMKAKGSNMTQAAIPMKQLASGNIMVNHSHFNILILRLISTLRVNFQYCCLSISCVITYSTTFQYIQAGSTRTMSLHDYYSRVIPESHHVPHLIYVYSTFCGQCIIWLRTTWQKAASDLEALGTVY